MANLRCNRRPRTATGVTEGRTYQNATLYTEEMAITEVFAEAYYVTVINDNGRVGTRYRASLFEEVVDQQPLAVTIGRDNVSIIENEDGILIAVIGGMTNSVEFELDTYSTSRTPNSFSCGVALVGNIQDLFNFDPEEVAETLEDLIRDIRNANQPREVVVSYDADEITTAIVDKCIAFFKTKFADNSAFVQISLQTDSVAYRLLQSKFDWSTSGRVNPNSRNEIMIGIWETNN